MIERRNPLFSFGQEHTSFNHVSLVNTSTSVFDETELGLSLGSRSFFDKVNDQVLKRKKRSSMNVTEDGEKHSLIW